MSDIVNNEHPRERVDNRGGNTGRIFTLLTGSKALSFTAAGAVLAARRTQIFLMNQHA
jgi:hypothetical protein